MITPDLQMPSVDETSKNRFDTAAMSTSINKKKGDTSAISEDIQVEIEIEDEEVLDDSVNFDDTQKKTEDEVDNNTKNMLDDVYNSIKTKQEGRKNEQNKVNN